MGLRPLSRRRVPSPPGPWRSWPTRSSTPVTIGSVRRTRRVRPPDLPGRIAPTRSPPWNDRPAELVVLSAWRTALGEKVRAEGLVGLPRSFLNAGASRVVVSRWKADAEATAELSFPLLDYSM
ncbi:MAG: CHAT domain-containing protein [bacterium]|nr:CHAT domain-containing protein [bacterium]